MALYFSGAVWASLALCVFYSLEGYLPHYRTDLTAISAPTDASAVARASDWLGIASPAKAGSN
jgi:hypothetical protein